MLPADAALTSAGPFLLAVGLALTAAGLSRWHLDAFLLLTGAGNTLIGADIAIQGAPVHLAQAGAANLILGLLLLLWWWLRRRGGRRRARRQPGAKSAAVRAALVRRMREAARPALAPG